MTKYYQLHTFHVPTILLALKKQQKYLVCYETKGDGIYIMNENEKQFVILGMNAVPSRFVLFSLFTVHRM